MPQSLAQIYLHIVFSTKDRAPYLKDPVFRSRTHAYLAGICKNLDSPSLRVGGTEDHVHIACRLSRKHSIAGLLQKLKEKSSKWIKEKPSLQDFYWQAGYGAFSVSPSHMPALLEYIANQEEHHRKESFRDEFRRILEKSMTSVMYGINQWRASGCSAPSGPGRIDPGTQGCAALALGFGVRPLWGQICD